MRPSPSRSGTRPSCGWSRYSEHFGGMTYNGFDQISLFFKRAACEAGCRLHQHVGGLHGLPIAATCRRPARLHQHVGGLRGRPLVVPPVVDAERTTLHRAVLSAGPSAHLVLELGVKRVRADGVHLLAVPHGCLVVEGAEGARLHRQSMLIIKPERGKKKGGAEHALMVVTSKQRSVTARMVCARATSQRYRVFFIFFRLKLNPRDPQKSRLVSTDT